MKLNEVDETTIRFGKDRLLETFNILSRMYNYEHSVIFSSYFMNDNEYRMIFEEISDKIKNNQELLEKTKSVIPQKRRGAYKSIDYSIHEFACVNYLSKKGYQLKIGPSKEKQYDEIMIELGFNMNFSYILDAYALGSRTADEVIHYIPQSRGSKNGQRIFFEDSEKVIKQRLQMSCDQALRYFCKISSISGYLLRKEHLCQEEIENLYGKTLKKRTINLVLENIIKPYKEAV